MERGRQRDRLRRGSKSRGLSSYFAVMQFLTKRKALSQTTLCCSRCCWSAKNRKWILLDRNKLCNMVVLWRFGKAKGSQLSSKAKMKSQLERFLMSKFSYCSWLLHRSFLLVVVVVVVFLLLPQVMPCLFSRKFQAEQVRKPTRSLKFGCASQS